MTRDTFATGPFPQRRRVLLIEDNLTQLDLYALFLEREFEIIRASRGETGYDLAVAERPDAIIVDVLLPDVDGLEICERLQVTPVTTRVPLIVLTGDESAFARAKLMRSIDAAFMKPCAADDLIGAVRASIAIRETR